MKSLVLSIALVAAVAAAAPAEACPADTSLEDGAAAVATPAPETLRSRHCSSRVAGNPKLAQFRRKPVKCETAYATRPARRRDAA